MVLRYIAAWISVIKNRYIYLTQRRPLPMAKQVGPKTVGITKSKMFSIQLWHVKKMVVAPLLSFLPGHKKWRMSHASHVRWKHLAGPDPRGPGSWKEQLAPGQGGLLPLGSCRTLKDTKGFDHPEMDPKGQSQRTYFFRKNMSYCIMYCIKTSWSAYPHVVAPDSELQKFYHRSQPSHEKSEPAGHRHLVLGNLVEGDATFCHVLLLTKKGRQPKSNIKIGAFQQNELKSELGLRAGLKGLFSNSMGGYSCFGSPQHVFCALIYPESYDILCSFHHETFLQRRSFQQLLEFSIVFLRYSKSIVSHHTVFQTGHICRTGPTGQRITTEHPQHFQEHPRRPLRRRWPPPRDVYLGICWVSTTNGRKKDENLSPTSVS